MNVLIISPFFPVPEDNGFKMRLNGLIRSLAGNCVYLVAFTERSGNSMRIMEAEGVYRAMVHPVAKMTVWKKVCNHFSTTPLLAKRYYSKKIHREIIAIIDREHIELLICESLLTAGYARGTHCSFRILDEHNLEFARAGCRIGLTRFWLKNLYVRVIMMRLKHYELSIARKFDWVLTCSEHDRMILAAYLSKDRVIVFENSLSAADYPFNNRQADPRHLIFIGTMWYEPNVDAALFFAKEIFPLVRTAVPDTRFVIAGSDPLPSVVALQSIDGVVVSGYQRDIRHSVSKAGIMVVPLRMGSGTRLKILVAMAMGIPVVSTRIGCEGLDIIDGEHIIVADTPEQFRDHIIHLMADPGLRSRISIQARKKIEEKYDRNVVAGKLADFWKKLDSGEAMP
jgi:glycosyltransferase involved in cell wall biosynthesis